MKRVVVKACSRFLHVGWAQLELADALLINIFSQLFNYLFFKGHLRNKHPEKCINSESKGMNNLFISALNFLNRIPNMALVVTLRVSAHRGYRAFQEARDPRDQLVQRDLPVVTDQKGLRVHEELKAMKDPVENRDFQAPREVQGQLVQQAHSEARVMQAPLEVKVPLAPKDHKAPRVKLERRVIQVLLEVKVPQAPRGLRGLFHVTGNSAF